MLDSIFAWLQPVP